MNAETVLLALLQIWPDLAQLVGPNWGAERERVSDLVGRLRAETSTDRQLALVSQLFLLIRKYPAALDRFYQAIGSGDQHFATLTRSVGVHRNQPTSVRRNLVQRIWQRLRPTVTRQTDISCPRRVWVGESRVTVVVRLRTGMVPYSAASASVAASAGEITVQIETMGFDLLNEPAQILRIDPSVVISSPVVFDLKPKCIGSTRVNFDFFRGTSALGTASVPVEVTAEPVAGGNAIAGSEITFDTDATPPDLVLSISCESSQALRFWLRGNRQIAGETFHPIDLGSAPAVLAARRYEQLTKLTDAIDPTTAAVQGTERSLFPTDVDARLRQLGQNLWRDLIPNELKAVYARERDDWRNRTLLVVSDEPYFPWELIWPYGHGWEDDQPWCLTMKMTRWLRRDERGNGDPGPPGRLHIGGFACLAPTDSQLPFARREREVLSDLCATHRLLDQSPEPPTLSAVEALLHGGGYDWCHVAAHGNFYPLTPDSDSVVWLEGGEPLAPDVLVGRAEDHIRNCRPGFVFNACHAGRMGWTLNRLGGWANRLISAGAGLFLAPLWTVRDTSALLFAETFYHELLVKKATVAEAVRQGRLSACRSGDPTWLAYTVYAHPNARVATD